jgi:hypothetical protein
MRTRFVSLMVLTLGAGCVFPDVEVNDTSTSAGGASTSSKSSNVSSTIGSTVTGSSSATSTATTATASTGTGGATCRDACTGGNCIINCIGGDDCDCDADGYHQNSAECGGMAGMVDCYDCNDSAKPGQAMYFGIDRGDGSFDYDCNNFEDPDYGAACGPTSLGCASEFLFNPQPGCGQMGQKYQCAGLLAGSCNQNNNSHSLQQQNCH